MKVEITKLDHYGRGVSRLNNKIVFIENALPHGNSRNRNY